MHKRRHATLAAFTAATLLLAPSLGLAAPAATAPAATAPAAKVAVDPRAEALVRRYLVAIKFERTMDAMQASMLPMMSEQLSRERTEVSEADRAKIVEIVRRLMREKMMPQLIDRMVPIYATTFTVPELEALVAFYEGPLGRSITDKIPSLAPKSAEITRELMPKMMAEVVQEVVKELCADGKCSEGPPKARAS